MAAPKVPAVELDVAGRTVRVTSPDRVVFPERGLTKLDVVQHFVTMGDGILGALLHRPTTLERWPKGVFEGATLDVHAGQAGNDRPWPRARAAAARPGHDQVVEGGAGPEDLRRLQPDGPRPHDRLRLLRPPQPAGDRVRAAALGRARPGAAR